MNFEKFLKSKKKVIIQKWFEATINTYPEETAKIFNKSKNKFDNPVGVATHESLESVIDMLCKNMEQTDNKDLNEELIEQALDSVIRIRAIQNFSASQAVGFVFELKDIVKKIAGKNVEILIDSKFDRKVDQISLAAFNRFLKCRESIFLLKAMEAKKRTYSAFERAGLVEELKDEDILGS
jgi:RsbT co-antagonist protein rsbRD N-terminal domain